jgi:uncharacterized protein with HEPN domain
MLNHAREAVALIHGLDEAQFNGQRVLRLAVTRLIQIVGEAARRLPDDFKRAHPQVPWQEVVGMRHILVHDYLAVDDRIIWRTAAAELPALIAKLEAIDAI